MPSYNTYESFSEISVGDIVAYTNKDGVENHRASHHKVGQIC